MVETEQSPEPLETFDGLTRSSGDLRGEEQDVADTLVISSSMVVRFKFGEGTPEGSLSEQDEMAEALRFCREHPA